MSPLDGGRPRDGLGRFLPWDPATPIHDQLCADWEARDRPWVEESGVPDWMSDAAFADQRSRDEGAVRARMDAAWRRLQAAWSER